MERLRRQLLRCFVFNGLEAANARQRLDRPGCVAVPRLMKMPTRMRPAADLGDPWLAAARTNLLGLGQVVDNPFALQIGADQSTSPSARESTGMPEKLSVPVIRFALTATRLDSAGQTIRLMTFPSTSVSRSRRPR